jgi:hypothetical protein
MSEYVVKVGRTGITEAEIRNAMEEYNAMAEFVPYPNHKQVDEGDYPEIVEYIKDSWKHFPKDGTIEEADPDIWLRRSELDCHIHAYALKKRFNVHAG